MIKSEPGLGLIERGGSTLSTDLSWSVAGATLSLVGTLEIAPGVVLEFDEMFALQDGNWIIALGEVTTSEGLWDARVLPMGGTADPQFALFTVLAGFGSGIRVEDGEIQGDVYVLQVIDSPEDLP